MRFHLDERYEDGEKQEDYEDICPRCESRFDNGLCTACDDFEGDVAETLSGGLIDQYGSLQ